MKTYISITALFVSILSVLHGQNLNVPFKGKPKTLGLDCCKRIRVSSTDTLRRFQSDSIGIYEATGGKMNNRLVFKHTERELYAYYWQWSNKPRDGSNWFIGEDFRSNVRRIESRNMQGRHGGWCITDINRSGYPFSVFAGQNGWQKDTYLRIECLETKEPCCGRIALVSNGLGRTYQPARLGIYSATALLNGRYYYTHELGGSYIYYWDWGPNSGANWVATNDPNNGRSRGIESGNVEHGFVNGSVCLNDARQAGEFQVYNGDADAWQRDRSLRVLCDPN